MSNLITIIMNKVFIWLVTFWLCLLPIVITAGIIYASFQFFNLIFTLWTI